MGEEESEDELTCSELEEDEEDEQQGKGEDSGDPVHARNM